MPRRGPVGASGSGAASSIQGVSIAGGTSPTPAILINDGSWQGRSPADFIDAFGLVSFDPAATFSLDLTTLANHAAYANGATGSWTDAGGVAVTPTFIVAGANATVQDVASSGCRITITAAAGTTGFKIPLSQMAASKYDVSWALGDWDLYVAIAMPGSLGGSDTFDVGAAVCFDGSYHGVYATNSVTAGAVVGKTTGLGAADITYTGSGSQNVLCISKRGGTYSVFYDATYSGTFPAHSSLKLVGSDQLNSTNKAVLNGSTPPSTAPYFLFYIGSSSVGASRVVDVKAIKFVPVAT